MKVQLDNTTVRHPAARAGAPAALRGLDLVVAQGEQVAVIGPSGAGKTTLLQLLACAQRPDQGSLQLDGIDPWALPRRALQRLRGRLFLAPQVPPLPPRQRVVTAVLAATALFGSYTDAVNHALGSLSELAGSPIVQSMLTYEIVSPITLVGVILGAATVFLFSGLAIDAVTRAAGAIVFEVRRQFAEIPGIMTGEGRPEYGKVVDICTRDSLRELATPGLLAASAPIAVGFGLGVGPLAGFLGGAITAGVLMAVTDKMVPLVAGTLAKLAEAPIKALVMA